MENVMMNSMQTQIKIVDFGLSNAFNPNSLLRTHCGSPEYAAPELFVPGKSYGPEVDLWSLGVILFGMVAGQLPFVVAHEENMASQERRKKLLVQINKGYSNTQRKILSLASSDFRAMVSRMLIPDAVKRITVNELVFDIWVTDKGRKTIITNPLKKLAEEWQISIMKQVSALLNLDMNSIQHARAAEPQGDVAGVFNILAYKIQDQRLEGDGVSKAVHLQRTIATAERKESPISLPSKTLAKKRIERVKSPSLHKFQKISTEATPRTAAPKRVVVPGSDRRPQSTVCATRSRKLAETPRAEPAVQQTSKETKLMFSIDARTRLQSSAEKHAREQLHYLKEQFILPPSEASQSETSSLPKARFNSAAPQRRLQCAAVRAQIQQLSTTPLLTSRPVSRARTPKNEMQIIGSKGIAKVLLEKKSAVKKSNKTSVTLKSYQSNAESIAMKNTSESTSSNKHVSTASPNLVHYHPRPSRVIPVMGTPSDSKVATTPASKNQPALRSSRRPVTTKPVPRNLERSPLAQGDGFRRRSSSATATKRTPFQRTILSDPIAKSIAGYLAKTMPTNPEMSKLKKTRSAKVTTAV